MPQTNMWGFDRQEVESIKRLVEQGIHEGKTLDEMFPGEGPLQEQAAYLYLKFKGAQFNFSLFPDPPDPRDVQLGELPRATASEVDLRKYASPVEDQGPIGSCFLAGTPILLENFDERKIEEVGIGNRVRTHTGQVQAVTNTFERKFTGKMYKIHFHGYQYPLICTEEHPIAVIPNISRRKQYGEFERGDLVWKTPAEIDIGHDYCLYPAMPEDTEKYQTTIDVETYLEDDIFFDAETQTCRIANVSKKHMIPKTIPLTKDFCKLIGFFLAEGCYRKSPCGDINGITFTFHKKETEYHQFVRDAVKNLFNLSTEDKPSKRAKAYTLRVNNSTLGRLFFKLCGEKSYGKFINPLFFRVPPTHRLELIRGWLCGDGSQRHRHYNLIQKKGHQATHIQVIGTTISEKMHRGLYFLSVSCGILPNNRIAKKPKDRNWAARHLAYNGKECAILFPELMEQYNVHFTGRSRNRQVEEGFLIKTKEIEESYVENLTVFNLEVEGDNSYVANGLAVHNCSAQACVGALELLQRKIHPRHNDLSRLFLYYNTRVRMGQKFINQDSGGYLRDAVKSLQQEGVCLENLWPYHTGRFKQKPPVQCYQEAQNHKISQYITLRGGDVQQAKDTLFHGYPIIIGQYVFQQFQSPQMIRSNARLAMPQPNERNLGGHAVLVCGYSDREQCFVVRNSWGQLWNQDGYYLMPYAYYPRYTFSPWVITK